MEEEMDDRKKLAKTWGKRIESARSMHKKYVVDWFEKVKKEFIGDATGDSDTGEKYEQVCQVIHSVEETIQPHLMFTAPNFVAKAKQIPWEKREVLVEAVINHEYRDILPSGRKLEYENELVLVDARMLPYGVTKTSYLVSGKLVEAPQEEQGFFDKAKNFFTGEKPELKMIPQIDEEKGHVTERIDPLKVFLDPMAKNLSRSRFIIEEIDATKEDLTSPRYEQDKVEKLKPNVVLNGAKSTEYRNMDKFFDENPDDSGYRIYEIHDVIQRNIYTYSEEIKDFIEFEREYPIAEGSQYSFLWFNDSPNHAYPVPPLKFYRKRALEYSYIYSQVSRQIDKFLPKIGVDETKLSPGDKERLKLGKLGTIFSTIGSPGLAVQQFSFTVQKDLFTYMGMIKEMLNLESGVNDYEMSAPEERKATEAVQIQQGTTARRFKPKKRVRDFLLNQAYVILQTLQQNQTIEKFVKVLGEKEALEWFEDPETGKAGWTKEQIAGQYSFDLDVEQATPMDSALKKRQRTETMQTVMNPGVRQSLMEEGKKLKIGPIFEKFVKEDLGISDRQSIIEDITILTPEQELVRLLYGQEMKVQQGENLEEHLQGHTATMNAPLFKTMPPEVQSMMMDHIQQTQQALMQKQEKTKPQAQAKPSTAENEPLMERGMEPKL